LIALSLRSPSRMSNRLKEVPKAEFAINILSDRQSRVAILFSRPEMHSKPFESVGVDMDARGIPIIPDCIGWLSCSVVASLSLGQLNASESSAALGTWHGSQPDQMAGSTLFLATVLDASTSENVENMSPLVYHRRAYVPVGRSIPSSDLHHRSR
jgi:flavin reductase (DIM6/NTAB) family NADH-FMN oxidoreductase RutF